MEASSISKTGLGLAWYMVFLLSLVLHEAAHALAAKLGGDETASRGGQVSIDPIPHIRREPFGTVVVPIVSYILSGWMMGWASAPYDPLWADRYPHRAARMALAGPLANFALAVLSGIIMSIGLGAGWFVEPHFPPEGIPYVDLFWGMVQPASGTPRTVTIVLSITLSLNLLLFIFNMLPLPPLDGSSVVGMFMSEEGARKWQSLTRHPAFSIFGLIAAWNIIGWLFIPFFDKIYEFIYYPESILYMIIFLVIMSVPLIVILALRKKRE